MKTKFLILPILVLTSCATGSFGEKATSSSFVEVAALGQINIASCYLKTKVGIASVSNSASSVSSTGTLSAHETDFYSNNDFKYSGSDGAVIGHTEKGFHYLLNATTSMGYQFTTDDPLVPYRDKAVAVLLQDYTALSDLYDTIKTYATSDAASLGFDSVNVTFAEAGDTVGYSAFAVLSDGVTSTEVDYYLTLDKAVDEAYVFTDVIIRTSVTTLATGIIAYKNQEYNLVTVSDYSSTNFVFNLTSYSIVLGTSNLSSIPSSVLIGK
jgi:hypothetical protein